MGWLASCTCCYTVHRLNGGLATAFKFTTTFLIALMFLLSACAIREIGEWLDELKRKKICKSKKLISWPSSGHDMPQGSQLTR